MYVKRHAIVKGGKRYVYLRWSTRIGMSRAGFAIACCARWAARTS